MKEVQHEGRHENIATGVPLVAFRLLMCHRGQKAMTVERVWAAVLGIAMLVAVSNVWTKQSATRQKLAITTPAAHTTAVTDSAPHGIPTHDDDWADPRVDLNGNEIDDAVSDYRVDNRGELYERHAPDTALLHLGAPRS
jgi:hypothetical protein